MRSKNNQVGRKRMSLFIRQVEKEAQQRMTELEARVETMLETIDKAFRVEMMKMPPSLLSTRMGALMGEEEFFSSEASAALKASPPVSQTVSPLVSQSVSQSLRRVPPRRVESTATPDNSTPPERTASRSSRAGKAARLPRTLASSSSTGNLGSSSAATKRSQSCATKTAERPKLRPRLRPIASTGDLHCAMAASAAHITVTTGLGQTISFSEETKHEVDLDLLDDVAWRHIQKLTSLMEHLSRRSRSQR